MITVMTTLMIFNEYFSSSPSIPQGLLGPKKELWDLLQKVEKVVNLMMIMMMVMLMLMMMLILILMVMYRLMLKQLISQLVCEIFPQ